MSEVNFAMETIEATVFKKPFPHLIINNFYNSDELELIWEELKFYTKPGKLLTARYFGGAVNKTNSHAIVLDTIYGTTGPQGRKSSAFDEASSNSSDYLRSISNILTVNRKLFTSTALEEFAKIDDCCCIANQSNYDVTKVRYYHNGEYYDPHTDKPFHFLAFSYFYKEPKRFTGGEVIFPKYNYDYPCYNNSMIILPGWVEHGVNKVSIKDSDYYDGYGRYCISNFFGSQSRR